MNPNRVPAVLLGVATLLAVPALAQAESNRQLLKLAAGAEASPWGMVVKAKAPSVLLLSLSSELATIAVLDGSIVQGGQVGHPGDALVTPLEGKKTERLQFDAHRLAATLPPEWLAETKAPLDAIAAKQARQRYWGLVQPVNLNASAPVAPAMEEVRASYLSNDAIATLRRQAHGNPQLLSALTATRFAAALAARDAATLATLIDPKPFTDTGAEAAAWQASRATFAAQLIADPALVTAMATAPAAVATDETAFDTGGYRIRLAARDRAMFVTAVEVL